MESVPAQPEPSKAKTGCVIFAIAATVVSVAVVAGLVLSPPHRSLAPGVEPLRGETIELPDVGRKTQPVTLIATSPEALYLMCLSVASGKLGLLVELAKLNKGTLIPAGALARPLENITYQGLPFTEIELLSGAYKGRTVLTHAFFLAAAHQKNVAEGQSSGRGWFAALVKEELRVAAQTAEDQRVAAKVAEERVATEAAEERERQRRTAERIADEENRQAAELRQRHLEQMKSQVKRWHDEQYPALVQLAAVERRVAHDLEESFEQGAAKCVLLRDAAEELLARNVYTAPTQELTVPAETFLRNLRSAASRCEEQRADAERRQVVVPRAHLGLELEFLAAENAMNALSRELSAYGL